MKARDKGKHRSVFAESDTSPSSYLCSKSLDCKDENMPKLHRVSAVTRAGKAISEHHGHGFCSLSRRSRFSRAVQGAKLSLEFAEDYI